jgi:uncharacterized membrane protein
MHQYLPYQLWFYLALAVLFAAAIGLIEFGVLSYAYEKMGINRRWVFLLLFLSLVGCRWNIRVWTLPGRQVKSGVVVYFMGRPCVVPVVQQTRDTDIAVNVGGAIIPTLLSLYLLIKNALYARAALGVAIVAVVVNAVAQRVPGVGIGVPIFAPPLIAAAVALLLSRDHAAPLAYIAGTLGTLIGADLLNLGNLAGLQAPVASIGGAGTFDGVFLSGIIAVLLA